MNKRHRGPNKIILTPWIIEANLDRPDGAEEIRIRVDGLSASLRTLRREPCDTAWHGEIGSITAHDLEMMEELLRDWLFDGRPSDHSEDGEFVEELPVTNHGHAYRPDERTDPSLSRTSSIVSITIRAYSDSDARFLLTTFEDVRKVIDPTLFFKR